jgi:hypothetical protein
MNKLKFKIGDFIRPIEGKSSSNYNDLSNLKLLQVIKPLQVSSAKSGVECKVIDGVVSLMGPQYYSALGKNRSGKTIRVYVDAFELVPNIDNYEIF